MNDTIDLDDPALRNADEQAIMEKIASGKQVGPEIAARVLARADRITKRVRDTYGDKESTVDLIREIRDE